jgi:hypothetical protein
MKPGLLRSRCMTSGVSFVCRLLMSSCPDRDFPFGHGDVLMPEAQGFTDPDTGLMEQCEEQPVPEVSA